MTDPHAAPSRLSTTERLSRSYRLGLGAVAVVAIVVATLLLLLAHDQAQLPGRHAVATELRMIALSFCAVLLAVLTFQMRVVVRPAERAITALLLDQESIKQELYRKAGEMHDSQVRQELQTETLQQQQVTLLEQQEELLAQQRTLIEQRDHLEQRTGELSRLTAILDAIPDAVVVFALTGEILYTNSAAETHLQHVRRRDWTHAAHLLAPDSLRYLRDVAFPHAIRRGLWQGEATMRNHGGWQRTVIQTLIAHRGPDARVQTVSVMLQDVTEQKELQERLLEISVRDPLTALYNRRGFLEQGASLLRMAERQQVPCTLLFGDLDSFKVVNDHFGHESGDAALRTIADILTATFRETDLVARLGGDEFTVLAIGLGEDALAPVLERIDMAVADSNQRRSHDSATRWQLGISLGATFFDPAAPSSIETLLRTADEAQYHVKRMKKSDAATQLA